MKAGIPVPNTQAQPTPAGSNGSPLPTSPTYFAHDSLQQRAFETLSKDFRMQLGKAVRPSIATHALGGWLPSPVMQTFRVDWIKS